MCYSLKQVILCGCQQSQLAQQSCQTYISGAVPGKTGKAVALPQFWKREGGGSGKALPL